MNCRRAIFIDDEVNVLKSIERLFRKENIDVVTTSSPDEALRFVDEAETAVFVSDQRMPAIDGVTLLEQIRRKAPETVRVTLTGYADKDAAIRAINRGAVQRFLTKPWNDDDLKREILQAIEEYELRAEVRRLQQVTLTQNEQLQEWNHLLEQKIQERTAEISHLNRDLRSSLMSSIAVMSRLAEMHSPTIGHHAHRVASTCKLMASILALDPKTTSDLYAAALLHDIGKVKLPLSLAQKDPGNWTELERESYRAHPVEGEQIIGMVSAIKSAATLVRHHHERWNGSGYPDRLVGDQIPLGARMIAVADAYDNALNPRHSFAHAGTAEAVEQVIKGSGTWYDPEMVKCLIRTLAESHAQTQPTIEVDLRDLQPGMRLAADIRSIRGVVLIGRQTVITEPLIERITHFSANDPIDGQILIHRGFDSDCTR